MASFLIGWKVIPLFDNEEFRAALADIFIWTFECGIVPLAAFSANFLDSPGSVIFSAISQVCHFVETNVMTGGTQYDDVALMCLVQICLHALIVLIAYLAVGTFRITCAVVEMTLNFFLLRINGTRVDKYTPEFIVLLGFITLVLYVIGLPSFFPKY